MADSLLNPEPDDPIESPGTPISSSDLTVSNKKYGISQMLVVVLIVVLLILNGGKTQS